MCDCISTSELFFFYFVTFAVVIAIFVCFILLLFFFIHLVFAVVIFIFLWFERIFCVTIFCAGTFGGDFEIVDCMLYALHYLIDSFMKEMYSIFYFLSASVRFTLYLTLSVSLFLSFLFAFARFRVDMLCIQISCLLFKHVSWQDNCTALLPN